MGDLDPALAVEVTCYSRAVRPVARRPAKKVGVVVVQDMYMDIAGCWESMESATAWM